MNRPIDLTLGERLLLLRRREKKKQREFAKEYGVSLYSYRQLELDEECEYELEVELPDPQPYEIYFIRRIRAEIPLNDFAAIIRKSRWWLCQMEHGRKSPDRLIEYWGPEKEEV